MAKHEDYLEKRRLDYQKAKKESKCFECGLPSWKTGAARCDKHRKGATSNQQKALERRKDKGICLRCDNKLSKNHSHLCDKHAQEHKIYLTKSRKYRIENRLCRNCGNEMTTRNILCQKCADYTSSFRLRLIEKIMDHYGRECKCCGITNPVFLTIDHINNDGNVHRKNAGKYGVYKSIVNDGFPNTFQILCWNCNIAKHRLGKCPHQK